MQTYYFNSRYLSPLPFIINDERSSIGYGYPRLFVQKADMSYVNVDVMLGASFRMTESNFMSWLDGTEIRVENEMTEAGDPRYCFEKYSKLAGMNPDALLKFICELQTEDV